MKKEWVAALAVVLTLSFAFGGTGLAKNDNAGKGNAQANEHAAGSSGQQGDKSHGSGNGQHDDGKPKGTGNGQHDDGDSGKGGHDGNDNGKDRDDEHGKANGHGNSTVTGDTYKHVPPGLINAFTRVQGTPAAAVIADKLRQRYGVTDLVYSLYIKGKGHGVTGHVYGVTGGVYGHVPVTGTVYESGGAGSVTGDVYGDPLTSEDMIQYADALRDALSDPSQTVEQKDEALEQLASVYEDADALDQAIDTQKDAVKENATNLKRYNKLSKLLEKKGDRAIKGYVNGEKVDFEVQPLIKQGSTLVPFRAISAALHAAVEWNEAERTVTVEKNGIIIKLVIVSNIAYVDGKEVELEAAAEIVDGSTVIPVRFIGEAFKADVQWDGETKSFVVNEAANGQ